jgi:hypothetical protein
MILLSVLMLAAEPSAVAAAAQPPVAAAPRKAKEQKICKTEDSDPGSHMVKRTCKTVEEWNSGKMLGASHSGFSISGDAMSGH